jgi:hypothetical protein
MNNERYLRISREEQVDFELDHEHVHSATPDDDLDDDDHRTQFSSPWRNQHNKRFHPVAQQDEADDEQGRDAPTSGATQIRVKSSPASSQHGSEGFLDDDMDDLSRYQLDFSDTTMARNLRESTSLEESLAGGHINLALLLQAYHQTQLETRRKRVDQLLSVTTESEKNMDFDIVVVRYLRSGFVPVDSADGIVVVPYHITATAALDGDGCVLLRCATRCQTALLVRAREAHCAQTKSYHANIRRSQSTGYGINTQQIHSNRCW